MSSITIIPAKSPPPQDRKDVQVDLLYLGVKSSVLLLELPVETYLMPFFQFLESHHSNVYKSFDLSGLTAKAVANHNTRWLPKDADAVECILHRSSTLPYTNIMLTFSKLCQLVNSMLLHITEQDNQESRVAVLVDSPMRGNVGLAALCLYSIFSRYGNEIETNIDEILFQMKKLMPPSLNVAPFLPSQKLYLNYFTTLIGEKQKEKYQPNMNSIQLNGIKITGLNDTPNELKLSLLKIEPDFHEIFSSYDFIESVNNVSGESELLLQCPEIECSGDILLLFSKEHDILFRVLFHSCFAHNNIMVFRRDEIDILKQFSGYQNPNFSISLHYSQTENFIEHKWMKFIEHVRNLNPSQLPTLQFKDSIRNVSTTLAIGEVKEEYRTVKLFGIPLEDCCRLSPSTDTKFIPSIVSICIEYLMVSGLESDGVFINPAPSRSVEHLKTVFETRNWNTISVALTETDPATVSSTLKLFLKSLPDKLIPISSFDKFYKICEHHKDNQAKMIDELRTFYNSLEVYNKATLMRLFQLLSYVATSPKANSNPKNLAMTFVPLLLSNQETQPASRWQAERGGIDVSYIPRLTDGIAYMILYFGQIFQIKAPSNRSSVSSPNEPKGQNLSPAVEKASAFDKFKRKLTFLFGGDKSEGNKEKIDRSKVKLFGGTLQDGCKLFPHGTGDECIPALIPVCIEHLKTHDGLNTEGLFRVPGAAHLIEELQRAFESCNREKIDPVLAKSLDPATVAGVLKIYFRLLKEPLIPFAQYTVFVQIIKTSSPATRLNIIKNFIRALPLINRYCAYVLFHFLNEVASSPPTQMNGKNLAICFAPNIVRPPPENEDPMASLTAMPTIIEGITYLIENINAILPKPAPKPVEPPPPPPDESIPPPPPDEPVSQDNQGEYISSKPVSKMDAPIDIKRAESPELQVDELPVKGTEIKEIDQVNVYSTTVIRGDLKDAVLSYEDKESNEKVNEEDDANKKEKENAAEALTEAIQARMIEPLRETLEQAREVEADQNLILIAQSLLIYLETEEKAAKEREEEAARRAVEEAEQQRFRQLAEEERLRVAKEIEESRKELERINKLKEESLLVEEGRLKTEADLAEEEAARIELQAKLEARAEERKRLQSQLDAEEDATRHLLEAMKAKDEARRKVEEEETERLLEEERQKIFEDQRKQFEEEKRLLEAEKKRLEEESQKLLELERKKFEVEKKQIEAERKRLEMEKKQIEQARLKYAEEDKKRAEEEKKRKSLHPVVPGHPPPGRRIIGGSTGNIPGVQNLQPQPIKHFTPGTSKPSESKTPVVSHKTADPTSQNKSDAKPNPFKPQIKQQPTSTSDAKASPLRPSQIKQSLNTPPTINRASSVSQTKITPKVAQKISDSAIKIQGGATPTFPKSRPPSSSSGNINPPQNPTSPPPTSSKLPTQTIAKPTTQPKRGASILKAAAMFEKK